MVRQGIGEKFLDAESWKPYLPVWGMNEVVQTALFISTLTVKAKTVVELGSGMGGSASVFSDACKITGGKVFSVDIAPKFSEQAKKKCEGRDNITFILGDSIEVGKGWVGGKIDVLLCDSDHAYEHVIGELNVWSKFNPEIILVHDTLSPKLEVCKTYKACKDWAIQNGWKFLNLHEPCGLGILLR